MSIFEILRLVVIIAGIPFTVVVFIDIFKHRKLVFAYLKNFFGPPSPERQAEMAKMSPLRKKFNAALSITVILLVIAYLGVSIYVLFFNPAAINVYAVYTLLYLNGYAGFMGIRHLPIEIRSTQKRFIKIAAVGNNLVGIVAGTLGIIGILSNKVELALVFTGVAVIGVLL